MFIKNGSLKQYGGLLKFTACKALGKGGGLRVYGSFLEQTAGNMEFVQCHSEGEGGGFHVAQDMRVTWRLVATSCKADKGPSS